jgi:hypothetical protein
MGIPDQGGTLHYGIHCYGSWQWKIVVTLIYISTMKKLILLFLAVAMLGCSQEKKSERLARKHIAKIEALIEADSTKGEDFKSFFEQFRKDTLFQQERVCLPFKQIITVEYYGTGGVRDSTIVGNDKNDWPFCSFLVNDSINYSYRELKVKRDTVKITLTMNPSSFDSRAMHAEFIRKKGKWINILLEIVSCSME